MTGYFPKKNYSNPLHHLIIPLKVAHSSFISQCAILHLVVSFLVWYFSVSTPRSCVFVWFHIEPVFFCLFVFFISKFQLLMAWLVVHYVILFPGSGQNIHLFFWSFSEPISEVRSDFKCQVQQILQGPTNVIKCFLHDFLLLLRKAMTWTVECSQLWSSWFEAFGKWNPGCSMLVFTEVRVSQLWGLGIIQILPCFNPYFYGLSFWTTSFFGVI